MSLRNQPYLPLYVQDYLTDEKLNMCSPATQGVYIKIMCVFHKSENYGGILLKQKDKQNESTRLNFANKLAKLLPFDLNVITSALNELLDENVLKIDGDFLYQKRMVEDNNLSITRAIAGKKGGKKTQTIYKKFAKAKRQANTENEIENEIEDNSSKGGVGGKFKKPSIEEIQNYYLEKCNENKIDVKLNFGEQFFNFYESKGWMIGKNKMKNWKNAVSTWISKIMENERNKSAIERAKTSNKYEDAIRELASEVQRTQT